MIKFLRQFVNVYGDSSYDPLMSSTTFVAFFFDLDTRAQRGAIETTLLADIDRQDKHGREHDAERHGSD